MTHFHWFHILTSESHWSLEVKCLQDHLGSKRGTRIESEHKKNLWVDTSHDSFSLISYFDLRRSLISGGQMPPGSSEVKKGYQNGIGKPKNYDLIIHMTYFHWFHILTYRDKHVLEVTTSRIIWGQEIRGYMQKFSLLSQLLAPLNCCVYFFFVNFKTMTKNNPFFYWWIKELFTSFS